LGREGYAIISSGVVNGKVVGYADFCAEAETAGMAETGEQDWTDRTKRFLKAELKRADVTYESLAEKMGNLGWTETKASVASKIGRGGFPASFFLAAMKAIGREHVSLEDI
jgi:hypothetical protein